MDLLYLWLAVLFLLSILSYTQWQIIPKPPRAINSKPVTMIITQRAVASGGENDTLPAHWYVAYGTFKSSYRGAFVVVSSGWTMEGMHYLLSPWWWQSSWEANTYSLVHFAYQDDCHCHGVAMAWCHMHYLYNGLLFGPHIGSLERLRELTLWQPWGEHSKLLP